VKITRANAKNRPPKPDGECDFGNGDAGLYC